MFLTITVDQSSVRVYPSSLILSFEDSSSETMKRKDFENAYEDFSYFSVAASARKSRRLDCELPQIIEEEPDGVLAVVPDQGFLHDNSSSGADLVPNEANSASAVLANDSSQELAIVLYNPAKAATQGMIKSPSSSNVSLVMNPELLSSWRSHMLHQGNQSRLSITELDEESDENVIFQSNNSMAVVPWAASQQPPYLAASDSPPSVASIGPMEADTDCEMMETETYDYSSSSGYSTQGHINGSLSGSQAALSHCQLPQYPPNTCTPIRW